MVNIPNILRARRRAARPDVVEFLPVQAVFQPQRQIVMLKDVTGWVNDDKKTGKKYHLNTGHQYYIDNTVADQFIIKGYASGELSREYSEQEVTEIRAAITTISTEGVTHG